MKRFALDCEMVGGRGGKSLLARVSIVDADGSCVYDKYVKPQEEVYDYRTDTSGITAKHLSDGESLTTVQREVKNKIEGCILVGHSVDIDLSALGIAHPQHLIRDVATYRGFMQHNAGMKPSLQVLAERQLGLSIQRGPHSSVEDAKAAMMLYNKVAHAWN